MTLVLLSPSCRFQGSLHAFSINLIKCWNQIYLDFLALRGNGDTKALLLALLLISYNFPLAGKFLELGLDYDEFSMIGTGVDMDKLLPGGGVHGGRDPVADTPPNPTGRHALRH